MRVFLPSHRAVLPPGRGRSDMLADSSSLAQTAAAALLGSAVVGTGCVLWQAHLSQLPSGSGHPETTTARVVELWVYPLQL